MDEITNQLSHLRLTHAECSIQIVNAAGTDVLQFSKRTAGKDHPFFSAGIEWPRISDNAERFPWVIDVWRRRTPRYDPRESRLGPGIGSVVDVPFSQGTVAMNSPEQDAFTQADIDTLQRLANVLSEGFQRYLDLFEQRRTGEQLLQAQKMEAIGQLERSRAHDGVIQLLLSDVVMPGMGGVELSEQMRVERPDISILLMSGYTHNGIIHQENLDEHTAFIAKPFTPEDLTLKVRQVLDA